MLPSSSGLGHRPFTAGTRVRISSGAPYKSLFYELTFICPDGGIGRHAGLRSQCASVRVRVSLGAPIMEKKHQW